MRTKVVHLSTVHSTFDIRIFHKECCSLASAGYETVFITPHPADETVGNVRILAVASSHNRLQRMFVTTFLVFRAAFQEKAALYHFHDPELLPTGILLSLLGRKVIYDVHEDVPMQILDKSWLHPWLRRPMSWLANLFERVGQRFFEAIVAATPAIASRFTSSKTTLVQNYPLLGELETPDPSPQSDRDCQVVFAGGITDIRGGIEMVAAMERIPENYNATLKLAGLIYPLSLESSMRARLGWSKVDFLGWRSREQLAELLARSRAGLVLFHPARNHLEAQPNKLFEYMSAGLPLIASDFPLWREIIGKVDAGLLVDPLNPEAIAKAICWIFDHPNEADAMGHRGRQAVAEMYNWDSEFKKLLELYQRLLL